MLRKILIIFGWIIPLAVAMVIFGGVYTELKFPNGNGNPSWKAVAIVLSYVDELALSPLCFFAARMLKGRAS